MIDRDIMREMETKLFKQRQEIFGRWGLPKVEKTSVISVMSHPMAISTRPLGEKSRKPTKHLLATDITIQCADHKM
jgi:hypothetical protein